MFKIQIKLLIFQQFQTNLDMNSDPKIRPNISSQTDSSETNDM